MSRHGANRTVRTDRRTSTQSSHQANAWTIATQTHREWIDTNLWSKQHDDDDNDELSSSKPLVVRMVLSFGPLLDSPPPFPSRCMTRMRCQSALQFLGAASHQSAGLWSPLIASSNPIRHEWGPISPSTATVHQEPSVTPTILVSSLSNVADLRCPDPLRAWALDGFLLASDHFHGFGALISTSERTKSTSLSSLACGMPRPHPTSPALFSCA